MLKINFLVIFFMFICSFFLCPTDEIHAVTRVSDYEELKQVLTQSGSDKLVLQNDIIMEDKIVIRGSKIIDGRGHSLMRSKKKNKVYGGTLFYVQGTSCLFQNISVTGCGKNKNVKGNVFGRLMEVKAGTLYLGENCVLKDNVNDQLAIDGGGALLIHDGGECVIAGATISGNHNLSIGAGIYVKKGGELTIKSGVLRGNRSEALGAMDGFDGKGAGIYNAGRVTISGGTITANKALACQKGGVEYGGVGGGIYTESQALLTITGGVIYGNKDAKQSPLWIEGKMTISGGTIEDVTYAGKASTIRAKTHLSSAITLKPYAYKDGLCLAKGKKGSFVLLEKEGYKLTHKKGGYYITKKTKKKSQASKEVKEDKNTEAKTNKADIESDAEDDKSSQKDKEKNETKKGAPVIDCKYSKLSFYVGEKVDRDVLLYGVTAVDIDGADITADLQILGADSLDTSHIGDGTICYKVKGKSEAAVKKKVAYQIKKNHAPKVSVAPRYLFAREVAGYNKEQWQELLQAECLILDEEDTSKNLRSNITWYLDDISGYTEGTREITLHVRDQYGHRYYMDPGEKRQYGTGLETIAVITVTLVDDSVQEGQVSVGHLRFVEPDATGGNGECWHFTAEDIYDVQEYVQSRDDPFDSETNQEFMRRYEECLMYEEDTGYE